ncbi:MAG: AarF/ABC1/UbiB kinase family protein [Myxococcales bacterium]|nr:AarF/ABC1/UbiB kinase family protein [Myxococcales bacterium]
MGDLRDHLRRGWAQRVVSTGRVAGSAATLAARQLAGLGDREGVLGERMARELDQMKGVAMKVGQILSYLDGVLPDETHQALRALQCGAEPAAYEVIAGVVEQAFGSPPEKVFERFDRAPIAAASIGQVHRGRHDGREVAVKVQYPGAHDTMVADVGRLRGLSRLASLGCAVDGPAVVAELAARFAQECDYALEAKHQAAFQRAFASEPEIMVAEVIPDRSTETVLTSEFCEGQGFYEFADGADPQQRDRAGLLLVRFALRSLFGAGMINADPHPGNYLFSDAGAVVFLDFGCVRRFDAAFIDAERKLARAVVDGRREVFREVVEATGMVADGRRFDFDLHWDMFCHQYEPFATPRFRFTSNFVRRVFEFARPSNTNLRRLAFPPQWIWMQRLLWGLYAVLAHLQAEGRFAEELRVALEQPFAVD